MDSTDKKIGDESPISDPPSEPITPTEKELPSKRVYRVGLVRTIPIEDFNKYSDNNI
ncbi:SWPV1-058 [Shearwaterpox virus]|uniref:SWPV1-058 n=1 Tax=Shearwaterpox virus TaxID=1974596 RepID=A0A1V0S7R8_CNPV|nr:SWPV1-058 [Shearwaterpox virus]